MHLFHFNDFSFTTKFFVKFPQDHSAEENILHTQEHIIFAKPNMKIDELYRFVHTVY